MKTYKFASDILFIRDCLDFDQDSFADEIGVSRSNIARYESGEITPSKIILEKIYNFAFINGFDINKAKSMIYEDTEKDEIILYHGARGEIEGHVDTKHSISPNDFGNGFYLGESLNQANMWISALENSSTYCFRFKKNKNLIVTTFSVDYNWLLAILYYRGGLDGYILPKKIINIIDKVESSDYLIAPIADNQMYDTIEAFRNNLISDVACLHALRANNLGSQYVFKSEKACKLLKFVDRFYLCQKEREHYLKIKSSASNDSKNKIVLAYAKYRKEGKMFSEIFKRKG